MTTMQGLTFLGNSRAELSTFDVLDPGPTQVLIRMKASGLCGSDLHSYVPGTGLRSPEGAYIAAGHEPAGVVVATGSLVSGFTSGDRVLAYHILGCGYCHNCRLGYQVNCSSASRAAYGGQRNGGHAEFMLAEDRSLIHLPAEASFVDGAMAACGFSTAYSATRKAAVTAGDLVLVSGLGPVGMAVALICADLGAEVIGVDPNSERAIAAEKFGVKHAVAETREDVALSEVLQLTDGKGCDVAVDCSGNDQARHLCLSGASEWGRVVFVGFGGTGVTVDAAKLIITKQLTLRGSWVSSIGQMEDAVHLIARRNLHPDSMIARTFALQEGAEAYELFAAGAVGKMAIVS